MTQLMLLVRHSILIILLIWGVKLLIFREMLVRVSYPLTTPYMTKVKIQLLPPNSNLTDTIDFHKETEDTSILFNHSNTTKEFLPPVLTSTHSALNLKNTNLLEHAICPELITLLFT